MLKLQKINYKISAVLVLAAVFLSQSAFLIQKTNAQASGQALEISPPVITLSADPGQTVTARVLVRNISSTDLVVRGDANDFVAAGEDGTPKVLLEDSESTPYSMKDWVSMPGRMTLVPKEIKTMNVSIRVPADASPGGHYGVIRFTGTPPNLEGQGVSLSASLGSLVLLSVSGNITENLSVEEFSVNKGGKSGSFFESLPLQLVQRIKNDGNIHQRSGGAVTISNIFNKNVATFPYNPGARYILPGSTRKFSQTLDKSLVENTRFFGRYTAKLTVIYGEGNKKSATSTITFWVIPWKLIATIIAGLVVGFFVIRFAVTRYNRHIINQSHKSRRR